MAFRFILQDQEYTALQLRQEGAIVLSHEAERVAAEFVRAWLQGEQLFTIHTSGSTGEPKAIQISRQHMQASARLTLQALHIQPADPALLCINPAYIGGKMMLVRALEGALPLRVVSPAANPLKGLPAHYQPLFAALVPLQLQAILADAESLSILNKMKAVIIGGAAVSLPLEEEAQQVEAPLYSTYGMTETVSHVALRRINGPGRQDYFTALPEMKLTTDKRGCLIIDGPVTAGPLVTNDVVALLGPDKFRWLGRSDNVLNTGGIKVQAEQLESAAEACLRELGLSRRLLAGGVPDKSLGQKVVLLIEGESFSTDTKEQLLLYLQERLPRYWAPKEILFLDKFVEGNNGKIKRKESWQKL